MAATDPVIVQAYRTPQGKEDGVLADVWSEDLSLLLVDETTECVGFGRGAAIESGLP